MMVVLLLLLLFIHFAAVALEDQDASIACPMHQ